MIWFGIGAFLLFVLSDLNDVFAINKHLSVLFPAGCAMLVSSVLIQCIRNGVSHGIAMTGTAVLISAAFLVLMLISLFGCFPAEEGYLSQGEKRQVYTGKMYALCRHPGVLWFIPLIFSVVFFGLPVISACCYSGLNILLALFEDRFVFPRVLRGYNEYRERTRFLIPDRKGIKQCILDYKRGYRWTSEEN